MGDRLGGDYINPATHSFVGVQRCVRAAPDGKSLKVTETDPRSGRTLGYIKDKQP
jgi:hypothetical protein